jgi:hypothetical protein
LALLLQKLQAIQETAVGCFDCLLELLVPAVQVLLQRLGLLLLQEFVVLLMVVRLLLELQALVAQELLQAVLILMQTTGASGDSESAVGPSAATGTADSCGVAVPSALASVALK